jgi:HlyD family secretion protein
MRSDLRVHRKADAGKPSFEVEDPSAGKRYPFHDFELSIARMLNGQRTVAQVLQSAGDIGIPVSLPSFQNFVRKLGSLQLLDVSGSLAPVVAPTAAGTTWEVRNEWPEEVRNQFQNALKAYRTERFKDAAQHLQMLLAVAPQTAEALDMLAHVKAELAKDPAAQKAPSFVATFNAAEATWFDDGDTGRSTSGEQQAAEVPDLPVAPLQPSGKKWLLVMGGVVVAVAAGLAVPLPYSPAAKCQLEARARFEVKVPRAGVVAENLVPDGQWVEKGAVLARLDGSEAKKKLEALAAQVTVLQAKAKLPPGNAKKAAAAKVKALKAEAEQKKAQTQLDQALAKAKQKKTPVVAKAEKKLAVAKAAAERAVKDAEAAEGGAGKAADEELAKLAEQKKSLEAALVALDIVAPDAGFLARSAKVKQTLSDGAVFGLIEDSKVLKVQAFFPERERGFVSVGAAASVTVPKAKTVEAKVGSVSAKGEEDPKSHVRFYEVGLEVDNADKALKSGAEGTLKVQGAARSLVSRLL